MRFEDAPVPTHKYAVIFEGAEIAVAAAVFRERIFDLATEGTARSNSNKLEIAVADWDTEAKEQAIFIHQPQNITKYFRDYSEATDEVIVDMPFDTGVPVHENRGIGQRVKLGREALQLAEQIEKAAETYEEVRLLLAGLGDDIPLLESGDVETSEG